MLVALKKSIACRLLQSFGRHETLGEQNLSIVGGKWIIYPSQLCSTFTYESITLVFSMTGAGEASFSVAIQSVFSGVCNHWTGLDWTGLAFNLRLSVNLCVCSIVITSFAVVLPSHMNPLP